MTRYELAQMNVARLRAPLDSPQLADFVDALDRINAIADGSPGFVWRLQDEVGNATALRPMGEDFIVNLSVWQDPQSLQTYVYRSDHARVMRRRREWFEKMDMYLVLWWVPRGHRPAAEEGIERLNLLRGRGPSANAFTFGHLFPAPGQGGTVGDSLEAHCPAT
ncbi:MAG: DUF3291 domain-containing protein [Pseudomonadota bacterium]|nr:DUF3291 domain-containing protein [Pseudomonadota bacterium]